MGRIRREIERAGKEYLKPAGGPDDGMCMNRAAAVLLRLANALTRVAAGFSLL